MNFCMPADFSIDTIELIKKLTNEYPENKIEEVYGNLSPSPILGSGRGWNLGQNGVSTLNELNEYIDILNKNNIIFNYTLNTSCTNNLELKSQGLRSIIEFIGELNKVGVKRITLASPSLIDIVHKKFPRLDITASVISGVDSVRKALQMKELGVSTIALQEDITRNFNLISSIHEKTDIKLEIIVNSMCNFNCLFRQNHYNALAHYHRDNSDEYIKYFCDKCYDMRMSDPTELIKSLWIRPEDIERYSNLGIGLFKFIGRERINTMNIKKLLEMYFKKDFDGNLLDLLNGFSGTPYAYIDNKELGGFLNFFENNYNCMTNCNTDKCSYCNNIAKKAIKSIASNLKKDTDLIDFYEYDITSHLESQVLINGLY